MVCSSGYTEDGERQSESGHVLKVEPTDLLLTWVQDLLGGGSLDFFSPSHKRKPQSWF